MTVLVNQVSLSPSMVGDVHSSRSSSLRSHLAWAAGIARLSGIFLVHLGGREGGSWDVSESDVSSG